VGQERPALSYGEAQHFTEPAQEYTLLDYLHEVEHMNQRVLGWSRPSRKR
jgi:hypothetical protein